MNPPFSVVFLTTLIGVGQGLFLALFAVELGVAGGAIPPEPSFFVEGDILSLAFLLGGLIASFFHLGHPERAWRAVAMWRTSWLSREVIALPVFMASVALHAWGHYSGSSYTVAFGAAGAAMSLALFYITAMNYVCIRFLEEWATPLTIVNYTLLGCASGFTFATAFAAARAPDYAGTLSVWAIVLTVAAAIARVATLLRNARIRGKSTLQSAIGVHHPRVAQKAQGFMGSSFNTREFFHGKSRPVVQGVKWAFLLLAFPAPVLALAASDAGAMVQAAACAFVLQSIGLLAERWFFFAQANHPQNLYYQAAS
ncbi:MAG: dimethyl sulfoxide reductase anchor subunit family protein [Rhodospirillaceae bacterium]